MMKRTILIISIFFFLLPLSPMLTFSQDKFLHLPASAFQPESNTEDYRLSADVSMVLPHAIYKPDSSGHFMAPVIFPGDATWVRAMKVFWLDNTNTGWIWIELRRINIWTLQEERICQIKGSSGGTPGFECPLDWCGPKHIYPPKYRFYLWVWFSEPGPALKLFGVRLQYN